MTWCKTNLPQSKVGSRNPATGGSVSEKLKKEMTSSFPYSPVICECSWQKIQIEKKIILDVVLETE